MHLVLRLCPWYLSKGGGGGGKPCAQDRGWSYLQPNPPQAPPKKQRPANAIMEPPKKAKANKCHYGLFLFTKVILSVYLFFGFPLPSVDLEEQLLASWSLLKLGRRLKGHIPSPKVDFHCLLNWSNRTDQKQQVTQTNNKLDFIRNQTCLCKASLIQHLEKSQILDLPIPSYDTWFGNRNRTSSACHLSMSFGWVDVYCLLTSKCAFYCRKQSTQKLMWLVSPQVKFARSAKFLGYTKSNHDSLVRHLENLGKLPPLTLKIFEQPRIFGLGGIGLSAGRAGILLGPGSSTIYVPVSSPDGKGQDTNL